MEKKKRYRSAGAKGLGVSAGIASLTGFIFCVLIIVVLLSQGMFPQTWSRKYEETTAFKNLAIDKMYDISCDLAAEDQYGDRDTMETEPDEYVMSEYQRSEIRNRLQEYDNGQSNITYLYVNKETKEAVTNRKSGCTFSRYEKFLEEMKKEDAYAVVDMTDGTYDAAFPGENRETFGDDPYDDWIEYFYVHCANIFPNDECILAFSIDTHFAAQDIFAANKEFYETYMPYTKTMIGVGAVCGVIFLLMLVWMTAAAGRRPEDEEVHPAFFDRIYTEIAAVLVIGGWAGGIWFLLETLNAIYDNNAAGMLGAFGGDGIRPGICFAVAAAVYTAVLFWTGYLSLVRRIKAHTFWKNSICGKCLKLAVIIWKKYISGKFLKFVIHMWKKYVCGLFRSISRTAKGLAQFYSRNVPARMKLTAELAVFFLGQFFCIMLIFLAETPIFLLFMAAFYVVEFFRLAKKAIGHDRIVEGLQKISSGEIQYKIPEEGLTGDQQLMAEYINNIGSGLDAAVENSLKNERMKTELITNVSHDIKTPLTSIINYVDLLKRENFTDPKICGYLDILEEKSQRLKTLTEDVVEASKASTGNITLEMADIDFVEMIQQVIGEFEEKFNDKGLTMMVHFPDEPSVIRADGRRMWRVLENIFNNTAKYAMEGTRVYAEIANDKNKVTFSLKNISAQALNISADELTERFIRGDVSRNTEGSGLGLSIAKSLTELQGGEFRLYVDGDLFKVIITFALTEKQI